MTSENVVCQMVGTCGTVAVEDHHVHATNTTTFCAVIDLADFGRAVVGTISAEGFYGMGNQRRAEFVDKLAQQVEQGIAALVPLR